jgi:hypothetical protein
MAHLYGVGPFVKPISEGQSLGCLTWRWDPSLWMRKLGTLQID